VVHPDFKTVDPAQRYLYANAVAEALASIHAAGWTHNDCKVRMRVPQLLIQSRAKHRTKQR
jgi:hypothetical protein